MADWLLSRLRFVRIVLVCDVCTEKVAKGCKNRDRVRDRVRVRVSVRVRERGRPAVCYLLLGGRGRGARQRHWPRRERTSMIDPRSKHSAERARGSKE